MNKNNKKLIVLTMVIILIIVLFYFEFFREIINVILISFFIAYSLRPIYKFLVCRGLNKRVSSAIVVVGLIFSALLIFIFIIPSFSNESINFAKSLGDLQGIVDSFSEKINGLRENKLFMSILDTIYEKTDEFVLKLGDNIVEYIILFGESFIEISVIPIIVYYFLADSELIFNRIVLLFPVSSRIVIKKIAKDMDKILSKYIISQLVLCLIVSVLTFVVLFYLNISFPLVLSIINGLFNIIPYFGPVFGMIPCVAIALLRSPSSAIYTLMFLYLIQQIEGNLISPKLTGDSVSIHPLPILLLLIIGGNIGGFLGMVLAIPIGVSLKIIYENINYHLY